MPQNAPQMAPFMCCVRKSISHDRTNTPYRERHSLARSLTCSLTHSLALHGLKNITHARRAHSFSNTHSRTEAQQTCVTFITQTLTHHRPTAPVTTRYTACCVTNNVRPSASAAHSMQHDAQHSQHLACNQFKHASALQGASAAPSTLPPHQIPPPAPWKSPTSTPPPELCMYMAVAATSPSNCR
jgi:hypothetical protein